VSAGTRLVLFALILAVCFTAAYALGAVLPPQ
jgi:hypothetical protein